MAVVNEGQIRAGLIRAMGSVAATLALNFGTAAVAETSYQTAVDAFVMACVRTAPDHLNARAVLRREGFTEDQFGAWTRDWLKIDPGKMAGGASPNPNCVGLMSRLDPVLAGDLLVRSIKSEGFQILSAIRKGRKTSIKTNKGGLAISFYVAPNIGGAMMSIFLTSD